MNRLLLFCCLLLGSTLLLAQEVRDIEGFSNNLVHPNWGAVGSSAIKITSNGYSDGISEPAGPNRPNPRLISNELFAQSGLINDPLKLSDFAWVFGQFIDHDITLYPDGEAAEDFLPILVPKGDPHFDPFGTGEVIIPLMRNAYDKSTGTDVTNPRNHQNMISAFIDGSGVYGSDSYRSFWVRSLQNGKLKMTSNNLLPFNTLGGEMEDPIDQDAPAMAMVNPFAHQWFIAGDVRANENTLLLSLHTLFAREHNRICDELLAASPNMSDRQLYQTAKRQVGAQIQAIVYEEWLPAIGIQLPAYKKYDANVVPGITNVFSAAAFRYGHTTINSNIVRMNNEGHVMEEGNTVLKDIFFNPMSVMEAGGIEALLKGMSTQVQQDFDCKIIDDLRNFLFGPPGAGGLDLAAINIQRGRERGLADYNTIRQDIGLPALTSFDQLSSNESLYRSIEALYQDINDIDPWVGMLAEDHVEGSLFGETALRIIAQQFQNLRDGDRFYYENDPALTDVEKRTIKNTRLADIIRRNFNLVIQDEVFFAAPEEEELSTSVQEFVVENKLIITPNPTTESATIFFTTTDGGNGSITLYNPIGVVLSHQEIQIQEGTNHFPIAMPQRLSSGLYIVQLTFKNAMISSKLVVKNK